ncbi:hypothetical protein PIB30_102517, partial [Stylosanthes scabra]|nr:hypothetical protein [Stylosanthes scabra]
EISGEDICSNPEVSNPGYNMRITCSCLRMIRSFRRSALIRSFCEGSGELAAEGVEREVQLLHHPHATSHRGKTVGTLEFSVLHPPRILEHCIHGIAHD